MSPRRAPDLEWEEIVFDTQDDALVIRLTHGVSPPPRSLFVVENGDESNGYRAGLDDLSKRVSSPHFCLLDTRVSVTQLEKNGTQTLVRSLFCRNVTPIQAIQACS